MNNSVLEQATMWKEVPLASCRVIQESQPSGDETTTPASQLLKHHMWRLVTLDSTRYDTVEHYVATYRVPTVWHTVRHCMAQLELHGTTSGTTRALHGTASGTAWHY